MDSDSAVDRLFKVKYLPLCSERKADNNKRYHTFCVKLEYADGINQEFNNEAYHLQATLFDNKYKKFIGSSWVGKPISPRNSKISFHQNLYFYTSISGKELILVVEIVTMSTVSHSNRILGWICLPLIKDDESGTFLENPVSYKLPVLRGTPLSLLILNEGIKGINSSSYATGMELSLLIMPYPILLQIIHLVPEAILLDESFSIPGLIQDPPHIINSSNYIYKPHLQKCQTFILGNVCIRIYPSVEEAEQIILKKILKEYETDSSSFDGSLKANIVQRRLEVGVHNGYCFVQDEDFYHLLVESIITPKAHKTHQRSSSLGSINFSKENGLILRSDIKIPNVPDDSEIRFVFLLEYSVSVLNANSGQSNITPSIKKSPTSSFAIAWGFVKLGSLKANPSQTVHLTNNPTGSPHKILFLTTQNVFELSFSATSLVKQNRNIAGVQSTGEYSPAASFSTKTYMSPETSYLHSPATSVSVPKHKSVGDIPMTVEQTDVGSFKNTNPQPRTKDTENSINLQEVTLVSSSLPLIPPMLHSFPVQPTGSANTFTQFYGNRLNPILDHYNKPAKMIDGTLPYNINKDLEFNSPPQQNECMIHLLGVSCLEEYSEIPSELFFTFQFYRFLPVRTESLVLKLLSENDDISVPKSSLVYALHKLREQDRSLGFQVTYTIDPSELGLGEHMSFLQYLIKQSLHIDLWNGQSLLYFGTILLPLKYLCRQGKDAVCANLELDVINCEFADDSLSQTDFSPNIHKGKLHIRLSNIRHPLTAKSLEKLEGDDYFSHRSVIISPKTEKTLNHSVSKARPIIETNRELTHLLATRSVKNCSQRSDVTFSYEERKRKLARMEAVRKLENEKNGKSYQHVDDTLHHYLKEREYDLLTIESYIQKNKEEMIHSLLHASVTYEKTIYPVIGNKGYFEFVLENPYEETKQINILWKCSQLSLVTDIKLWQMLRNSHKIPQKVQHLEFRDLNSDVPCVFLQSKEKVHIPFTYSCLITHSNQLEVFKTASGHHFMSDLLTSAPISRNFLPSSVKIRFMTEDQNLLAILILKIQPLPPAVTHVFKFLSMEHSMFKKLIRINSDFQSQKISVCSSDPEAVCSIQEPQDWEDDIYINIKAPTKAAGNLKEFCVFLYKDYHQVSTFQTWIITICPLQRIDLSCISGQLMRSSLLIRGTYNTNLVQCFSSSSELQLHPSNPFLLSPFAVQELSMNVRSLLPGIKHFQITMVNQSLELVQQSWLLVLSCQKPSVSKAFQVHLSVGKDATKKITYTNPYGQSKTFVLYSSHSHLIRLRESKFSVPAGKSYSIGLYFPPQDHILTETLFLYLNDTNEKNEETYCIKVICQ